MQSFSIRKSITGAWLVTLPCPVTGTPTSATVACPCALSHITAIARALTHQGQTCAQEIAIVAEGRYKRAMVKRAARYKRALAKREIMDTLDSGFLPSLGQLKRAFLLER